MDLPKVVVDLPSTIQPFLSEESGESTGKIFHFMMIKCDLLGLTL